MIFYYKTVFKFLYSSRLLNFLKASLTLRGFFIYILEGEKN